MQKKFYITTPIYYVNDKPHIGHAYATLLADVLARWHKMKGENTWFLAGTDEHGAKIAEAAQKHNQAPQEFTDEISALFRETWKNLNIVSSDFIRTTENRHKVSVSAFMSALKDKGYIYEGTYEGLYCTSCERFYTEKELTPEGQCPDHKRKPETIREKNYFFKLKSFLPEIIKDIEEGRMKIYPKKRYNEVLSMLEQELTDISVSREHVKWGIPLPFDTNQTIYVWVEALQNYISALGYDPDEKKQDKKFTAYWPADIQIIGKDIAKFHCIFWPALLKAMDLPVPKKFIITGFFTVDGQKMSKTIGNVIDPNVLLKDFGVDGTRYLILSQFPVGEDGDIKASGFHVKYNADLADTLGNLCSRVANMIHLYSGGKVSVENMSAGKWEEKYEQAMNNDNVFEALAEIFSKARELNREINEVKPWEKAKRDKESVIPFLQNWAARIAGLGYELQPFLPTAGRTIHEQFQSGAPQKKLILFPKITVK